MLLVTSEVLHCLGSENMVAEFKGRGETKSDEDYDFSINLPRNESVSGVDIVGYQVVRRPGEKVHFCSQCDFPISVYGRLEPCHHAFCYTCASSNSNCFLCDTPVTKASRLDHLQGLYLCGAQGCLKSFHTRSSLAEHTKSNHMEVWIKRKRPKARLEPIIANETLKRSHDVLKPRPVDFNGIPSSGTAQVSGVSEEASGGPGNLPRPESSQRKRSLNPETGEDRSQGQGLPFPPANQHQGLGGPPFMDPRMQGHHPMGPDFYPGPFGPMGMHGPGMMGPMGGPPGPMGPHWGDFGPMGGPPGPYMGPHGPYPGMPFNGPPGGFRPGGHPEDPGFWGGPNFGPGPGFGGGWRPPP